MPFMNPFNDKEVTEAEFDAWMEKCEQDMGLELDIRSDHVYMNQDDLFDHSVSEILEYEERDKENGEFISSCLEFD